MTDTLAIIVDLDGTVLSSNFKHTIPQNNTREEWDDFHKLNHFYNPSKLTPIKEVIDVIESIYTSKKYFKPMIVFLTAREDTADGLIRLNTYRFIKNNFKIFDSPHCYNRDYMLLMRNKDDFRSSEEIKEDFLKNIIIPNYIPVLAFEDEENNTNMFKNNGITVLRVYNKE